MIESWPDVESTGKQKDSEVNKVVAIEDSFSAEGAVWVQIVIPALQVLLDRDACQLHPELYRLFKH